MKRRERLDDDFAFHVTAPSATRHLSQELEGPFAGAKVRLVQRQVGVDDANECHIGEMKALGDHLGAQQYVDFARAKVAKNTAVIIFPFQSV